MTSKILKFSLFTASSICVGILYKSSGKISQSVSDDFLNSSTLRIINPNNHKTHMDSLSLVIESNKPTDVLLKEFIKGFFYGPVMLLERNIFRLVLKDKSQLVYFDKLNGSDVVESNSINTSCTLFPVSKNVPTIWDDIDINLNELYQSRSILFGAFQISEQKNSDEISYIDAVFGNDISDFAGGHRFEVIRLSESKLKVTLHLIVCNPTEDIKPTSQLLNYFHIIYSRVLFLNALYEMRK